MFTFLLILQTLIAIAMISVILMQRSEGGGFAGGGSPAGMMSARGAADFLTRSTGILATVFVILSIAIAAIAAGDELSVVHRPGHGVTVSLMFRAWTSERAMLPRLLEVDGLAAKARAKVERYLEAAHG